MTPTRTTTSLLATLRSALGDRLDGTPLAVMLDLDGTLAPIASTPAQAAVPRRTRDTVERLAGIPGVTVAIVSGRAAEDAARLAPVRGAWIVGNHGLEVRAPDGSLRAAGAALPFEEQVAHAARLLEVRVTARGTVLENKRWTLSVHYRQVDPGEVAAVIAAVRDVGRELGLRISDGKKVLELRPPVDVHKGTAVVELARQVGALGAGASALYAGDDRTDEDAFRELRAAASRAVTLRVASGEDRIGEPTDAEFSVNGVEALRDLLEWMARRRSGVRA